MRATIRLLEAGETDVELLAVGVSAGTAALGCAWVAGGLPLPRCAFHAVTGCPCPTCGATRCVLALLHGHASEALKWNPLVFAGLAGLALLNLYGAGALMARLPRIRLSLTGVEARILRMACVIVVAANWAYEIHHGV